MRTHVTVYKPGERPDMCLALDDGTYCPGEVRMKWQEGGEWWVQIQYRPWGEHTRRIVNVPAGRVKRDETDYSASSDG